MNELISVLSAVHVLFFLSVSALMWFLFYVYSVVKDERSYSVPCAPACNKRLIEELERVHKKKGEPTKGDECLGISLMDGDAVKGRYIFVNNKPNR